MKTHDPPTYFLLMFIFYLFAALNGYFLYSVCQRFAAVRDARWAKALLLVTFSLTGGMVIWIGDINFAMTLPFYLAGFLIATRGNLLGRIVVGSVFFCLIMSVCAMSDMYLQTRMASMTARPLAFGLLYILHRRAAKETVTLPQRLWKLCAGLALLPFASLSALILPAYWMPDSVLLHDFNVFQGVVLLPIALLSSSVLLQSILILADYEHKAQAATLSSLREVYYQGLKREQRQVRTLRHDLRNHLNAALGLMARGETDKAQAYLQELADSPALHSSCRICENELVNVVISAKLEEMRRLGIHADVQIALPDGLTISDTDLCSLLSNALDNAIEAAYVSDEKRVAIHCREERGLLMLCVENSVSGTVAPDLRTTKKDKRNHGFGLSSMREITQRHGGVLSTEIKAHTFELVVALPLTQV